MACDKSFASSHMLLDSDELSFADLIKILFSSNLKKRKFVDSSQDTSEGFSQRWIIFISILVQKILQLMSKPLSFIGSVLEYILNLLWVNGGILMLMSNILKGKLLLPDRTSANFYTFLGHADTRLKLDSNIKCEDGKYLPALSMLASKLSYENKACCETIIKDHWKMEFLGFYNYWNEYQEKATTQAILLRDKNEHHDMYVVAFRGTELFDADAWSTDFDISWYEFPGVGKIHGGFMKALGLKKCKGWPKEAKQQEGCPPLAYYDIREKLRNYLSENKDAKFIVTGHSLGGALASLFPAVLAMHEENSLLDRLHGVYTFGQPRVGDKNFANYMQNKFNEYHVQHIRFVYCNDMVPRLPFDDKMLMFKHFGTLIHYDRNYNAKILAELPFKNYFSILAVFPMMVNAIFELLRGFTIARIRGNEYEERFLMTILRIMGIIIPGVPPHIFPDYINSTRLGSSELFSKIL